MKVLFIVNNLPEYKERFIREFSQKNDITVVAEKNNTYPNNFLRKGYSYFEVKSFSIFGLRIQPGLIKFIFFKKWDRIICSWNMRFIDRFFFFFIFLKKKEKWIWWGHILGSNKFWIAKQIRILFLKAAKSVLIYSDKFKTLLMKEFKYKNIFSFNNSEVSMDEFRESKWTENSNNKLSLLFVGRYQKRKNIEILIDLLKRKPNVELTLVGPGMLENFSNISQKNLKIIGPTDNNKLDSIFNTVDLVVNPGHLGLLISNAARYGKPIAISNTYDHAPEVSLAYASDQFFLDFDNNIELNQFIEYCLNNKNIIKKKGNELQRISKDRYNLQYMVKVHNDSMI